MRKNKDVLVYHREKGKKLFLVAVQLEHKAGSLSTVATTLENAKYSLLSGFVSSPGPEGYSRCSFFVEALEGRPAAAELVALMEKTGVVKEVEVKGAHNGLIADSLNFPLSWNSGDRAVMLRTHFFAVMEEGARRLLASGADVLLYQMGYNHGRPTWDDLLAGYRVRDKDDLQEIISLYPAAGWGLPEVESLDIGRKKAVVKMTGNFECDPPRKGSSGSNFLRGHLAGLFTSLFGATVNVKETKCVGRGDPHCEFTAST